MKKKSFYVKLRKANFELFYYLFYDYHRNKISYIIYDLINFSQLLSINVSFKVILNF